MPFCCFHVIRCCVQCTGWLKNTFAIRQERNRPWKTRSVFGRPLVKRFALCYQTVCPVCPLLSVSLFVFDVGVLWPNGWMDQDATWCGGRPWPRRHCVRWGPNYPSHGKGHSNPHFRAHVYCGQTVAHLSNCLALVFCATAWRSTECRWTSREFNQARHALYELTAHLADDALTLQGGD